MNMKDLKVKFALYFKAHWPILVILLLVILFFWRVIFSGLVPIPGDITVGLYFPWLDYKWGFEVGVPVKNNLPSDIVSVHLPFRIFAANQISQGNIPLWNNLVLSGTPLIANFQSAFFYPLNILLAFTSVVKAWSIQIMLQPLITAIFTYLLLRNWKLSKTSSLFGATAFAFTGFLLIWLEYNIHGHVAYWLPAILLVTDKYLSKAKIIYAILLSFFVALSLLAGYPQLVLYEGLAVAIYLLFRIKEKEWLKRVLTLTLFGVLGVALAAVQIIPAFELLSISNRSFDAQTLAVANQGFLPVKHLLGFFAPDYFGNPSTGNWWGVGFYDNFAGYASVVALTLALIGIISYPKRSVVKFLVVLFGISILLALKSPLSSLLFQSNLLGFQAAVASRALFLSGFSIALLSSFGVEGILKVKWNKNFLRATYPVWVVLLGVGIGTFIVFVIYKTFNSPAIQYEQAQLFLTNISQPVTVGLRNLVLPFALILASTILLFISRYKKFRKIIVVLLFLLLVFDLFRFGFKYITFVDSNLIFPKTPVIEFLLEKQASESPFRVEGGDVIPMNMLAAYGLETVEGYDAYYSLEYAKYLSEINNGVKSQPLGRYGEISNYNNELIDISNARYILALKRDEIAVPSPDGIPDYTFRLEKLTPVFEDGTVLVLENTEVFDRAFLEEPGGNVEFLVNEPKYKKLMVKTQKDSNLVISETYYPGWIARVDGKKVDITRARQVYKSIKVDEGEHVVEFIYNPDSFRIGAIISASTLFIIFLIIIYGIVRAKNRKK